MFRCEMIRQRRRRQITHTNLKIGGARAKETHKYTHIQPHHTYEFDINAKQMKDRT